MDTLHRATDGRRVGVTRRAVAIVQTALSPRHRPLAVFVVVTVADLAVTLPLFHLEANPVVTALGVWLFAAVKIGILFGISYWWYARYCYESRLARIVLWAYDAFMAVVLALNAVAVVTVIF